MWEIVILILISLLIANWINGTGKKFLEILLYPAIFFGVIFIPYLLFILISWGIAQVLQVAV